MDIICFILYGIGGGLLGLIASSNKDFIIAMIATAFFVAGGMLLGL